MVGQLVSEKREKSGRTRIIFEAEIRSEKKDKSSLPQNNERTVAAVTRSTLARTSDDGHLTRDPPAKPKERRFSSGGRKKRKANEARWAFQRRVASASGIKRTRLNRPFFLVALVARDLTSCFSPRRLIIRFRKGEEDEKGCDGAVCVLSLDWISWLLGSGARPSGLTSLLPFVAHTSRLYSLFFFILHSSFFFHQSSSFNHPFF